MSPTVSVIIPVFNRAHLIERTIKTVAHQTFKDWELIIVDDCSSDDLLSVLKKSDTYDKIKYIRHETNKGVSAARNTGIRAATGEFVAFLDSDDQWLPEKLQRQIETIGKCDNPGTAFCVTKTRMIFSDETYRDLPERPAEPGEAFDDFLFVGKQFAQASSFFVSQALAERILFHEEMRAYEDYYFFIKAGSEGAQYMQVDQPLTLYWNDDRDDRLSKSDDLEKGLFFLAVADPIMTDKAKHTFWCRTLAPIAWRYRKWETLTKMVEALRAGALPPFELITLFSKCLLGEQRHKKLRQFYLSRRGVLSKVDQDTEEARA